MAKESIKLKYLFITIVILLAFFLFLLGWNMYISLNNIKQMFINEGGQVYNIVKTSLEFSLNYHFTKEDISLKDIIDGMVDNKNVLYIVVQNENGIITASSNIKEISDYKGDVYLQDIFYDNKEGFRIIEWNGNKIMEYCGPFDGYIKGVVRIGLSWSVVNRMTKTMYLFYIVSFVVVLLLIIFFHYYLDLSIERKENEERRKRIEDSMAMVSTLGHQLRNPLNTMKLIAQNADYEYKDEMINQIDKMNYLIGLFLNSIKKIDPVMEKIDLREFIEKKIEDMKVDIEKNGIEVYINGEGKTLCDKILLSEIIENILRNSIESMDKDKKIIEITISNNYIEIEDNGIGMGKETIEKLFTPFYTTKKNGTGLGLVAVRRYLDIMGGDIKIESEKNKGTVVKIWLKG